MDIQRPLQVIDLDDDAIKTLKEEKKSLETFVRSCLGLFQEKSFFIQIQNLTSDRQNLTFLIWEVHSL